MSNLIPMDEAARILGMTVEQVSELRSNNEIFGYKDGANWKFKMSELERVAGELGLTLNTSEAAKVADDISESFGFDLSEGDMDLSGDDPIEDLDSEEYMEDSSVELANPADKGISVGKDESVNLDDDGELELADSGLLSKSGEGTSKELDADIQASQESILDDDEDELSFGTSSLSLASESSRKLAEAAADAAKSGIAPQQEDDFSMPDDDFTFADDSGSFEDSAELSSDFEDSGALILDDSDSSAEITLEANESGINLSASASGLSLEDSAPLDLGMSDIDELELPADDDDMIVLENAAAPDAATQMLQEDDFDLTPLEPSADDDDSSGSQVIALEDSEIYADDSAATILGDSSEMASQPGMLEDAGAFGGEAFGGGFSEMEMQPGYDPTMVPAGPAALPEAPYSLLQVLSLGGVAVLLSLGGMVAYNLAQNLWMPSGQVAESGMLPMILKIFGGE